MWQRLRAIHPRTERREWVCGVNPSLIKPIPFQMTVGKPMINALSWGPGSSDTATKATSLSRSKRRPGKVVLHLLLNTWRVIGSRDPLTCQRKNCKRIDCLLVKGPWEFHRVEYKLPVLKSIGGSKQLP